MLYGLDIGGSKMELAIFDHLYNRLSDQRVPTPTRSYDDFLQTICDLVHQADKTCGSRGVLGIGIPGFLDPQTAEAHCANIPCTRGRPVQSDLETRLERPVTVENDANCFVLSEAIGGAGDNCPTVFGVILGTGCGGGLYINGQLHSGRNRLAGEWGHTPLPYTIFKLAGDSFPIVQCGCGLEGCLDNYISGRGLELIDHHISGQQRSAKTVTEEYMNHCPVAQKSVRIYTELLASSLGAMINTLDPDTVVLGGGLSNFNVLYQKLPELLPKYTLRCGRVPEVRKACFGDSSGIRGAALLGSECNQGS